MPPILKLTDCAEDQNWIVCQIGARENYAVARALEREKRLAGLVTDAWIDPNILGQRFLPRRLKERWHEDLVNTSISALNPSTISRQLIDRTIGRTGWRQILARNAWFQKEAAKRLSAFAGDQRIVFSYSYAAGEIFSEAKRRGWRTVLGQIDPGPVEARLVSKLYEQAGQLQVHEEIPEQYWEIWKRELELADKIVVNSEWSKEAMISEGVAPRKIAVIPLAYERISERIQRVLPTVFTARRPLQLLFLGQVSLRKGIHLIFEALRLLENAHVKLEIVGPIQVDVPDDIRCNPKVEFHGAVPRSQTDIFYRRADLFLFPTFSDGFGLTQLEAFAESLPIVTSRFCGDVVKDGVNGRILQTNDAGELANVIRALANDPGQLSRLQKEAYVDDRFRIDTIGKQFIELFDC